LIGIPDADASGRRMEEVVSEAIEEALAALPKPRRRDPNEISEAVRRASPGTNILKLRSPAAIA
jgi:ribonuclease J